MQKATIDHTYAFTPTQEPTYGSGASFGPCQISVIAGERGVSAFSSDGSSETSTKVRIPSAVWVDSVGDIYFTDQSANLVRKLNASNEYQVTILGGTDL